MRVNTASLSYQFSLNQMGNKKGSVQLFGNEAKEPTNDIVTISNNKDEVKKEKTPKDKALLSKKWGLGLASLTLPGSGQLINGDPVKGVTLLTTGIALWLISESTKIPRGVTFIFGTALGIFSCIDAVKNAKPNEK